MTAEAYRACIETNRLAPAVLACLEDQKTTWEGYMSWKDILVHADTSPQCRSRLDVATRLARQFDAHLTAICVIPESLAVQNARTGWAPPNFVMQLDEIERERARNARILFETFMAGSGVKFEWREQEGLLAQTVAMNARYSDLSIVSQSEGPRTAAIEASTTPAEVALSAGRPVLVVPYIGAPREVGSHILVGWNASREATRAVNDAMPLLRQAKKVTVLAIDSERGVGGHGELPCADISLHLARHGVNAEAAETVSGDIDAGDVILSTVADLGADLIVIGAYGHSRTREYIFGGVTRHLLAHMTVPVMMSH
jgi:nucleotide-binding universal stress UspA family protein